MRNRPDENDNETQAGFPAWTDCDYFCIQDYAGSRTSPCGWRGRIHQVNQDPNGAELLCPKCGSATLLRIPRAFQD